MEDSTPQWGHQAISVFSFLVNLEGECKPACPMDPAPPQLTEVSLFPLPPFVWTTLASILGQPASLSQGLCTCPPRPAEMYLLTEVFLAQLLR
jgi:hypothetical protein